VRGRPITLTFEDVLLKEICMGKIVKFILKIFKLGKSKKI
jgi:hypothetical protein